MSTMHHHEGERAHAGRHHEGHVAQTATAAHAAHAGNEGHDRHAGHSIADFRKRFWWSLALTAPVLALSPMIQSFAGLGDRLRFGGDAYVLFAFASVVYFYGGFPFLRGIVSELGARRPGMMTLVAVAITTAWLYSTAVVLGLAGMELFWELVTLVDIMLLGHWIEMRSVTGASRALEELAALMPSEAHRLLRDGRPKTSRSKPSRSATGCWCGPAKSCRWTAWSSPGRAPSTNRS
jgi:Cu2+-exporting ATPase